MAELKYKDITEKIIGAAFDVHGFLGNGFQEVIYQRALAWEMEKQGLGYQREKDMQQTDAIIADYCKQLGIDTPF